MAFSKSPVQYTLVAVVIAAALGVGVWLGTTWVQPEPEAIQGTVLDPPRQLIDFRLVDHHGRLFSPASLRGKWSFLFFGYTHCPDVCPTTLRTLARMDDILRREQPDIHAATQVVFVSVDPQRDTQERLAEFVPHFSPGFVGVTGEAASIEGLARELGIGHMRVERGGGKTYLMEHSTAILLLDPHGRQRAVLSAPHQASTLADDFEKIARQPS